MLITLLAQEKTKLSMRKVLFHLLAGILLITFGAFGQAKPDSPLRVMTFNIHHGEGRDRQINLERIAALIKQEKADIVALQEVDKGVGRTARRDLIAELAALTGMTGVFSNNFHFQGGQYGNAILTRFPVLDRKNTHYLMLNTNEQRGVLQLVLDAHGKKVLIMDTHIDYRPQDEERLLNVAELRQIVASTKLPVIICGDFNSTPESRPHQLMSRFVSDAWELSGKGPGFSFPSGRPDRRIDYIWISTNSIAPVNIWVPVTEASDHCPVVAELILR
jgi:endonuclease/exonuclease/phosphatase family metal-dependent hydrolase